MKRWEKMVENGGKNGEIYGKYEKKTWENHRGKSCGK